MKFWPVLIVLLSAAVARAEIVHLTDGTTIEGKLARADDGWTVTQSDGKKYFVASDKVAFIEVSRSQSSPSDAADRLASLRSVAAHLTDLNDIISRYEKFISQTTDADTLAQANKDLAQWQGRLDQGMVKLGDQWITSDERDRRRQLALGEAMSAKDLIPAYRYKDADRLLQQALTDDPRCAAALYLNGVMLYKQEQVSKAKKNFEAVRDIIADHAPTLNNLAVVAWRQKSFVVAMNYYDMAMMAAPQNKDILDNVAEALNAVPDENKQAPVVQQAVRLFAEQDAALQKTEAAQGRFRWGSSWVSARQLDDLKAREAKIKDKQNDLLRQADDVQVSIDKIDAEINANLRQMRQMEASSLVITNTGTVQMPLPDVYYAMARDNDKLGDNKKALQQQQQNLRNESARVAQDMPVPLFTGVQQLIGVEGLPVRDLNGAAPTTAPSPDADAATRPGT